MVSTEQYGRLLDLWLEFLRREEFNSVQLKAEGRDTLFLPQAALDGDQLRLDERQRSALLTSLLRGWDPQGDHPFPDDLYLLFPLLEFRGEGDKPVFLPTVALRVSTQLERLVRAGEPEFVLPLDLEDASNFGCIATVLTKAAAFEDLELDALIMTGGLGAFVASLGGERPETVAEACRLLRAALKERTSGRYHLTGQLVLARLALADYSLKLQRDLQELKAAGGPESGSCAAAYLSPAPAPTPALQQLWFGHFDAGLTLGDGQAQAMRHLAAGQPLLAVQGPPGTGKTALILNVIAQQVVSRALALAGGGTIAATANLTLVVSDTAKAVENVVTGLARRLPGDPLLWFEGGSYARVKSGIARFDQGVRWLEETPHDPERQAFLQARLLELAAGLVPAAADSQALQEERLALRNRGLAHENNLQALERSYGWKLSERDQLGCSSASTQEVDGLLAGLQAVLAGPAGGFLHVMVQRFTAADRKLATAFIAANSRRIREITGLVVSLDNLERVQEELQRWHLLHAESIRLTDELAAIDKARKAEQAAIAEVRAGLADVNARLAAAEQLVATYRTSRDLVAGNTELFELAVEYLRSRALGERADCVAALKAYRSVLLGERSAAELARQLFVAGSPQLAALSLCYPVLATTLNSAKNLVPPLAPGLVDLVVADEASMIPCLKLYPLLYRSRRGLVVGDPKQLPAVVTLTRSQRQAYYQEWRRAGFSDQETTQWNPAITTAYHRAAGVTGAAAAGNEVLGAGIVLEEHRRSVAPIAEAFFRIGDYANLRILTAHSDPLDRLIAGRYGTRLAGYHVLGEGTGLVNSAEVALIAALLERFRADGIDVGSAVGVITPFRKQEWALVDELSGRRRLLSPRQIGTVHKFQGQEYPIVVFSPVVTRQAAPGLDFINTAPNLLNVAVSRAKSLFVVAGNLHLLTAAGRYTGMLTGSLRAQGVLLSGQELPAVAGAWVNAVCMVTGAEHLLFWEQALSQVGAELQIVTRSISGRIAEFVLGQLRELQGRGIKVSVFYAASPRLDDALASDPNLVEQYHDLLGQRLVRLAPELITETAVLVDGAAMLVGQWDWLGHPDFYLAVLDAVLTAELFGSQPLGFADRCRLFAAALTAARPEHELLRRLGLELYPAQSAFVVDRTVIGHERERLAALAGGKTVPTG